ncbi:MAG: hypothetical protein OEW12_06195 [Deltaproteobacteria bacterium]|nr:hypothetical protein [Deltaproteobacteria bacterium]
MSSNRFYLAVFLIFISALMAGMLVFFSGMRESSFFVNNGLDYVLQIHNKYRYQLNLQGLIYTGTFLGVGVLVVVFMLLLGDQYLKKAAPQTVPQPRRRPEAPEAPKPAPQPRRAPPSETEAEPETAAGWEEEPLREPPPKPTEAEAQALEEPADIPATHDDTLDDDDVIYGTGRISEQAILEFVQTNPDSATKFLYRKTLDNKSLSPIDEDIYRSWERRGMTRPKMREIVLIIMGWDSLPEKFPHDVWRELRDRVFDSRITYET